MSGRRTIVVLSLLAALAAPATASAHATLVRSTPANGDVLRDAPRVVRLEFDDDVQPLGGSRAVRSDGASVLAGRPRLAGGTRRVVTVPLRPNLTTGDYTVLWRVLSDDGHVIQGVLAFGVGVGRAPPVPSLAEPSTRPSARAVVARWLLLAGLLAAAGTALFGFALAGALGPGTVAARRRVSSVVCLGCALFVVGGSALEHHSSWQTRFGASVNIGIVIALVAATLAAVAVVDARARVPAWLLTLALVPVPSVAGHALDPGRPWPNLAADVVHVLAASVWLGTLLGLALVVPVAARVAELDRGRIWTEAGMRASTLALVAVSALGVTGVFRALWELTSPGQLVSTGYGRTLLVKSGLLLALVAVGFANRSRLVPLLAGDGPLVARLRRNVGLELGLFALLVGAVAVLTQSRPGRDLQAAAAQRGTATALPAPAPPRGAIVLAQQAGTRAVAIAVQAHRSTVTVLRADGLGAGGLDVRVDGVSARPCGDGCYSVGAAPGVGSVTVGLPGRRLRFALPRTAPAAAGLVRRASAAFRRLRSVVYRESLYSAPGTGIETVWRVEAPDRLRYDVSGGASAVVIGRRRWDRGRGGSWRESVTTPLDLPVPVWVSAERIRDARLLGRTRRTVRVSFVDPTLPAWFDVVLDRRTLLPRTLRMTAAAHFMRHRYVAYNRPLEVRPPKR